MILPIGRPCRFGDCEPGQLLRVTLGEGSSFALALAGGDDDKVTTAIVLSTGDIGCVFMDEYEPLINYGKEYIIRESMDSSSLRLSGVFNAGGLRLSLENNTTYATLMFTFEGRARFYDFHTGRLGARNSGVSLDFTKWSLALKIEGSSDLLTIYSRN